MELYAVPRNTMVRVIKPEGGPPGAPNVEDNEIVKFHHLDGMYSYCHNKQGQVVHLPAWQEVEIVNE